MARFGRSVLDRTRIDQFLGAASEVPPDITFLVVGPTGLGPGVEVAAHRLILALVSPQLRTDLAGTKDREVVTVRGSTPAAFRAMVGLIYSKEPPEPALDRMDLRDVFETVGLAERYNIPMMKDVLLPFLQQFPITRENVMQAAATAQYFSCLREASERVIRSCAVFLEQRMRTIRALVGFAGEHAGTQHSAAATLLMVEVIKITVERGKQGQIS
jgi:hypothetical protein